MSNDWAIAIQATAAAVSAAAAAGLGFVTVWQLRTARRDRDRDLAVEQRRRIGNALRAIRATIDDHSDHEFQVARAELAGALAIRPIDAPDCAFLLRENMQGPPYGMGDLEPWQQLEDALQELRRLAATPS